MSELERGAAEQSGERAAEKANEKQVPHHSPRHRSGQAVPPLDGASPDEAPRQSSGQARDKPDRRDDTGSQLSLWPAEAGDGVAPALGGTQGAEAAVSTEPVVSGEPAEQVWTLTDLGAFVLFVVFVSLPVAFLGTAGVFLGLRAAFGWEMTVTEAFTRAPAIVGMQTSWEALWLGFIWFTVTVKYRRRFWEAVRWTRGAHRPRNWLAAGAALALTAQLYFFVSPTETNLPIEQLFSSPGAGYVLMVFGILVAPFVEELVFRGFFYPVFEERWGFWAAVVLTAVLFAAIHASQLWGGWEEIAAIFVVGMAFSYSRGRTGSLVPSYLMHLGYNTALFASLYLSTDAFRTLNG